MSTDALLGEAIRLLSKGKYSAAERLLAPVAVDGAADALCLVGTALQCQGRGPDAAAAFRSAVAAGSSVAANNLFTLFMMGCGLLPPHEDEARRYAALARAMGFVHGPKTP
jgi:hypothetical protein